MTGDQWGGRLQRWGLHAGVALGLGLALLGLRPAVPALPDHAVASVNGTVIARADWQQALDAVAADRRTPLTAADRRRVLDRLIDEELLLQYAVDLDLVRSVPSVRTSLVGAVLQAQVVDAESLAPDAATLQAFFAANRGYFARGPESRVRGWRFTDRNDAAEAVSRLRAGGLPNSGEPMPLPAAPMDAGARRNYLGATLAALAESLPAGAVSDPQAIGRAWYVLRIDARQNDDQPSYEEVADEVRAEWQRRRAEEQVQAMLDRLRAEGRVSVRDAL